MEHLLWIIIAILVVFWVFGLVIKIGGKLIHLALIVALVLFVINLLSGGRFGH